MTRRKVISETSPIFARVFPVPEIRAHLTPFLKFYTPLQCIERKGTMSSAVSDFRRK